uniref:F-box domain-containing protein n=1 Tax=Steinernema glaseri TaxID=37863 RepID=A0A1I7Z7D5_9BILA
MLTSCCTDYFVKPTVNFKVSETPFGETLRRRKGENGQTITQRKIHVPSSTTMDAVPWKFVDSVVELLGKDTLDRLARETRQPLWRAAVDLHHCNRVYYRVALQMTNQGIKHAFLDINYRRDSSVDLNIIRKNRRFIRILWIKDDTSRISWMFVQFLWYDIRPSGEPEIAKLMESLAQQIDPSSWFNLIHSSPGCQRVLLTSLINKAQFGSINLSYYGQISHDFLEDQINNSPFLERVLLTGKWPQSVLPLLATFCLKEEHRRPLCEETNLKIDINYLRTFFDAWKANGRLQCSFRVRDNSLHAEERRALKAMGRVEFDESERDESTITFKHEEKKSCECDLPKDCRLLFSYPKLHNL